MRAVFLRRWFRLAELDDKPGGNSKAMATRGHTDAKNGNARRSKTLALKNLEPNLTEDLARIPLVRLGLV